MTLNFVDTNLLIYAVSNAEADAAKKAIARRILHEDEIALSAQVLQEFYWVATRPYKLGMSHGEAVALIDIWKLFPVMAITLSVVEDALALCQEHQLSYWDAAILAAARHLNCSQLYTEDFQHGRSYSDIVAVNPFLGV